jgi:hypothetical protein
MDPGAGTGTAPETTTGPQTLTPVLHTFAAHLLRSGTDLATLRDLHGHSDISVTSRYLGASPRRAGEVAAPPNLPGRAGSPNEPRGQLQWPAAARYGLDHEVHEHGIASWNFDTSPRVLRGRSTTLGARRTQQRPGDGDRGESLSDSSQLIAHRRVAPPGDHPPPSRLVDSIA